jgi:SOS-response transcriptional repressor LexA
MKSFFSIDEFIFGPVTESIFIIRLKGMKKRLHLAPGDFLVVDKKLPFKSGELAVVVIHNKFQVQILTGDFIQQHCPEHRNFIWGMVTFVVREL